MPHFETPCLQTAVFQMVITIASGLCVLIIKRDRSNSSLGVGVNVKGNSCKVALLLFTTSLYKNNFRTTCMGLCSGAARLGAITGIMIGEYDLFSSFGVSLLAAIVTLLSAGFIKILPDLTEERMPVTLQDITKVQFPELFKNENVTVEETKL